jgi:hypothetical protein
MIGSKCLVCDAEVQEFERFYIVKEGIVHAKCRIQPGAEGSEVSKRAAAPVRQEEQDHHG